MSFGNSTFEEGKSLGSGDTWLPICLLSSRGDEIFKAAEETNCSVTKISLKKQKFAVTDAQFYRRQENIDRSLTDRQLSISFFTHTLGQAIWLWTQNYDRRFVFDPNVL